MATAEQMRKLGIAEHGLDYPSQWNTMGGWHGRMFGSYQMSIGAWTSAGGTSVEWGANKPTTANFARQTEIAGKYFDQCGDDYANYNLGTTNANNLRNLGSQPLSAASSTVQTAVLGQAWGKVPLTMPCNQVLQRCEDYYNNGKTSAVNFTGADGNPYYAGSASAVNGNNGLAGGTIELWLSRNTTDPSAMNWNTDPQYSTNNGKQILNMSELFYVPDNIALAGSNSFNSVSQMSGTASGNITLSIDTGSDISAHTGHDDNNYLHFKSGSYQTYAENWGISKEGWIGALQDWHLFVDGGTLRVKTATMNTNNFTAAMSLQTDDKTGLPFVASSTNMYMFKPVIFGGSGL